MKTGKPVWRTQLGNINIGETITMAPLVAKGRVYVGNSGGELGVRGWIVALDENTGKLVWRAYNTGPDADVLIGAEFKPFYASEKGTDLGVSTWPAEAWKIGGGTVWGWVTYDAGTRMPSTTAPAIPGPGMPSSVRATTSGPPASSPAIRRAGAARWYYQILAAR